MPRNDQKLTTINAKHKKFVRRILDGETMSQAASSAGFGPTYGSSLMKQPAIRSLLVTEMERAGINDTLLATKLLDGLDAMAPPRRDGGKQYADQFVRKQFLDVIFKVRGDYAPDRTESTEKHITIVMDGRMVDALRDSKMLETQDADILEAEIVSDATRMPEDNSEPTESEQVDRPLPERSLLPMPDGSPDS
jgi:hypothetical protein